MSQRTAILIAFGLTAFLLVIGGAVVGQVVHPTPAQAAPQEVTSAPVEAQVSPDVQGWMEREAAYQELIRQANQKLEQAYAQQAQSQASATAPAAAAYAISADQAAEIALQAVMGAKLLRPAELVDFQGVAAYEVALNWGMVYVDANTGKILYNGALAAVYDDSSSDSGSDLIVGGGQPAGGVGGGNHGGGDDHGGDDD